MSQHLGSRARDEQGFTLVELLVVIVIVGVLAVIALPMFLGQSQKAQDSDAKAAARNLVSHMEACFADDQSYATCPAKLTDETTGLAIGAGAGQVEIASSPAPDDRGYTVIAHSRADGGRTFSITRGRFGYTRDCAPSGGGCPGSSW